MYWMLDMLILRGNEFLQLESLELFNLYQLNLLFN